jgi:hypothetical protein
MRVSMLTRGSFGKGDRRPEREKKSGREASAARWWNARAEFLGDLSYEVKAGEPAKSHLTTRMVTSSLKSSPQKSAAVL